MSDPEFDLFAEMNPVSAIASRDPRLVSSAAAFAACARVSGVWALDEHPLRVLEFPDLACELVRGYARYFGSASARVGDDEVVAQARVLLRDLSELMRGGEVSSEDLGGWVSRVEVVRAGVGAGSGGEVVTPGHSAVGVRVASGRHPRAGVSVPRSVVG